MCEVDIKSANPENLSAKLAGMGLSFDGLRMHGLVILLENL